MLVLGTDDFFHYVLVMVSKELYRCSVSDLYNLRSFLFAIVGCNCFRLGVHRYSPFSESNFSSFLYQKSRKVLFRVHRNCAMFIIWQHLEVLWPWSAHVRQYGVASIDVVSFRSKSSDSKAAMISIVDIPARLGKEPSDDELE